MATFVIGTPDGKKFEISAPEGTPEKDVLEYFRSIADTGTLESLAIGAGRTFTQLGRGAQQAWYAVTGDEEKQKALKQQTEEEGKFYGQLQATHPIATGVGEALPYVAGLPATGTAMGAAAVGAVPGLLEYGTPEEKLKRAAIGGVAGAAGNTIGKLLVRGQTPASQASKGFAKLTGGQESGSTPVQTVESVLQRLPGSSGRMSKVYEPQQQAINKAALERSGLEAAGKVTREMLDTGVETVGGRIGDAAKKIPLVQIDDIALNRLAELERSYGKLLDAQQKPVFKAMIDDIIDRSVNGRLTGEAYQNIRSLLGETVQGMSGAQKHAFKGLQKTLDDAAVRSATGDVAKSLLSARGQYRNLKSIDDLLTPAGNISAARLATRGTKPGKLSPSMSEVAKFANVVKAQIPDSGTAQRSFWTDLLTKPMGDLSLMHLLGATGVPAGVAQVATRAPVRNLLAGGLVELSPEMAAKSLAGYTLEEWLKKGGGLLGAGAAGALTQ